MAGVVFFIIIELLKIIWPKKQKQNRVVDYEFGELYKLRWVFSYSSWILPELE